MKYLVVILALTSTPAFAYTDVSCMRHCPTGNNVARMDQCMRQCEFAPPPEPVKFYDAWSRGVPEMPPSQFIDFKHMPGEYDETR